MFKFLQILDKSSYNFNDLYFTWSSSTICCKLLF